MSELEDWYRESLVARIDALNAAKNSLLDEGSKQDAVDTIRRIAHSIKGSGGTFGFPEISEKAELVEEADEKSILSTLDPLLAILQQTVAPKEGQKTAIILIIDDDPDIIHLLSIKLADPTREIITAGTLKAAKEHLKTTLPSLVVLDLILPDGDGRSFLMHMRENPDTAGIPVVVLSGKNHPTTKAECYALGANGFFEKPFDPDSFSAAVASNIQRSKQLLKAARQDWLTKLPNRAAFSENFKRAHSYAMRQDEPLLAAILDIDNFKSVNDVHGHAMGDEVLRRMSAIISSALRKSDFLARWGGEEFVVLMPNTDLTGGAKALEKALEELKKEVFISPNGTKFSITFSAGIAKVPVDGKVEDVIAEADRFLYIAKSTGKAKVCMSDSGDLKIEKTILFAEDDEIVAAVVKHRLGRQGFKVKHFNNGANAFKAAQNESATVVILDVKMPGMDGLDLLSHLRQLPDYANIPIVMLTGMGKEQDTIRALELGADDYIIKPFSPNELLARVRRLIRNYENTHH
ncbi:MAG: response regulator [Fidelibacterota bacterium]